ncbi:MAG: hypothetical protein GOU99_02705, partial [Candidatus Altiarchaeota archaeon]|nr:hypothetical protein [Candidatus Altiarchaeota archaeon]
AYAATSFDGSKRSGMLFGASVILAMMSRVTGVLVIPLALLFLGKWWYEKRKIDEGLKYGVGILAGFLVLLVLANIAFFGNPLQFGGASLQGGIFTGSRLYYFEAADLIYTLPIFYLALAGLYFAIDEQKAWPTAVAFLTYFLWFSIIAGEKVPRYILQTVPIVAVLAVFSVYSILKKLKLDERFLAAAAVLVLFSFPQIAPLVQGKVYSYTGFQELGTLVAELDSTKGFSTIYSQSTRQIRAFSGIDYDGEGGNIRGLPQDVNELLNQTNIALQVDVWEYSAPSWIYPISQEKINFLLANNFTIAHTVIREYPTNQGLQEMAVGVLLVK